MNINKFLLISILYLASCILYLNTFAQEQTKTDSLLNELKNSKTDTNKVKFYLKIGDVYEYTIPDTALYYYNNALKIAKRISNNKFIARCLNYIGIVYGNQGNYPKAIECYKKSLKINEELGDQKNMSGCYINIGTVHNAQGNYSKAIEYYHKSLKINEEIADSPDESLAKSGKKGISDCYSNIGIIYYYQGNYSKAIECYQKSLKIDEELGNRKGMSGCYTNIGVIHDEQGNYSKAIEWYQKSLKIKEELGDRKGISNCYNNIGIIYKEQGNYSKAIKYYQKSLRIFEELDDKQGIAASFDNIASLNIKLKEYNKAIEYATKSLNIAKEICALLREKNAYALLSTAYEGLNNYKKSLEYYKLYSEAKDSLFNEESHKQITEMTTKYETEKKEKEITLLNKEKKLQKVELAKKQAEVKKKNIQRNAFIGGFVLVLVLVFVVYRGYSQKKKSNKILTEKNVLITKQKAELNQTLEELRATQEQLVESEKMASLGNLVAGVAHEINTPVGIGITASSSLVEETKHFAELYKKDKMSRKALEEYLESTFQTSKLILKNMNRTGELVQSFKQVSVDQMADEKRKFNLNSYLNDIMLSIKPEFGKKTIKVDIDCDKNLELNSFPGAFAQIITNLTLNSIRHGFREKEKGHITITAKTKCHSERSPAHNLCAGRSEESSHLLLQYKDDGTGISKENLPKIFDPFFTTNKQIGTGLGLHIVYNLVTQKLKGSVSCESEEGKGVLFTVSIPMNE